MRRGRAGGRALAALVALFAASTAAADPVDDAFGFLARQQDRFHAVTLVAGDPDGAMFQSSGRLGAVEALSIDAAASGDAQVLRLTFDPHRAEPTGWAGLAFQASAPRDLTSATRLTAWLRAPEPLEVDVVAGETLRIKAKLGPEWQEIALPLHDLDLRAVTTPFTIVFAAAGRAGPQVVEVGRVEIDLPRLQTARLLQSYRPQPCALGMPGNVAYLYDQAVVLLAYLARGSEDDRRRAALLADSLVAAQRHDRTFKDGRLRNAYASGDLLDPGCDCARLPGAWHEASATWREDAYAAGSDTGNLTWAGLALLQAHLLLPRRDGEPYKQAAVAIARWIVETQRAADSLGGFRGGLEGFEPSGRNPAGQQAVTWRSTEHNIDLAALFGLLAEVEGRDSPEGRDWQAQASHARTFVSAMRDGEPGRPYRFTGASPGGEIVRSPIPLDVQAWSVLGLAEPAVAEPGLDWSLKHCRAGDGSGGFDFNCEDGDGSWWEGTAQMAAALQQLGRRTEAGPLLQRLAATQARAGSSAGAVPAASRCDLTTGFHKTWDASGSSGPWLYTANPHIAATAWFVLAALGDNPFRLKAISGRPKR